MTNIIELEDIEWKRNETKQERDMNVRTYSLQSAQRNSHQNENRTFAATLFFSSN